MRSSASPQAQLQIGETRSLERGTLQTVLTRVAQQRGSGLYCLELLWMLTSQLCLRAWRPLAADT